MNKRFNPFDFRASFLFKPSKEQPATEEVSIPLISGRRFYEAKGE